MFDTRLAQLAHRRRTLPELAEIARMEGELRHLRDLTVAVQTTASDLEREQSKADTDVDLVRSRAARDQGRLDAGTGLTSKELVDLQSEIASLARRQGALEEVELEIMERLETVQAEADALTAAQRRQQAELDAVLARRDALTSEIDTEVWATQASRDALVSSISAPLIVLYDKIRTAQGGVGAAELRQRRCAGCRLEINTVDMNVIKAAAADEVLRCEECSRILIRTGESGLS